MSTAVESGRFTKDDLQRLATSLERKKKTFLSRAMLPTSDDSGDVVDVIEAAKRVALDFEREDAEKE
jgi:hypothetical protein